MTREEWQKCIDDDEFYGTAAQALLDDWKVEVDGLKEVLQGLKDRHDEN